MAWTRAVALGEEVGDGGDPAGDRGVGQVAEADHKLRWSGDVIGAVKQATRLPVAADPLI